MGLCLLFALCVSGCQDEASLDEIRRMHAQNRFAASLEPLRVRLVANPDDPELNYLYGLTLLETGSPDTAIWSLRKAARSEKWARASGIRLGQAALATQEWENAIAIANQVLESDPETIEALLIRANARLEQKTDPSAALEDFERVLDIDPTHLDAHAAKVATLIAIGDVDEAAAGIIRLEELAIAANAQPDFRARVCTIAALFASERGLDDEADQRFSDCRSEFPDNRTLVESYVGYLDEKGRVDEAHQVLRATLARNADDSALRISLARRLISTQRFDESAQLLEEGTKRPDLAVASDAWAAFADHYAAKGELSQAADAYQKSLDMREESTVFHRLTYADILAQAERNEEALKVASQLENDVYRGLIEARVAINRDDPAKALARLDLVLPNWPNNPGARYWAARAAEQLGDFPRAIEEYRQSIRSGAGFTDSGIRLARLHLAEGAGEAAWGAVSRYVDEHPNDPEAAELMMKIASVHGPDSRLQGVVRTLVSRPSWPFAVAARAQIVARAIGPKQGFDTIRKASNLDLSRQANLPALRGLVDLLIEFDQPAEALQAVDEALKKTLEIATQKKVQRPDLLILRGRALGANGRGAEAKRVLEEAIAQAPLDASAHEALGIVLANTGASDEAMQQFARARELDPERSTAYLEAAIHHLDAGEKERAAELWRALLKERPENSSAAYGLARLEFATAKRTNAPTKAAFDNALRGARRAARFGGGRPAGELLIEIHEARGEQDQASGIRAKLQALPAPSEPASPAPK